jgi:membrane dipeptidase
MSDDMIKVLAQHGGVIQINFGSSFLNDDYRKIFEPLWLYLDEHKMTSQEREAYVKKYRREHPIDYAHVEEVAMHIDHVVKLVGIDFVGLDSDFDGVGDSLPTGLKDVAGYPNLIYELLKKGYSRDDIEKICSGNILRVWGEVEKIAKSL